MILAWHILRRVSRILMEPVVDTTITSSAPLGPHTVRFTPASMDSIYPGAQVMTTFAMPGPLPPLPLLLDVVNITDTTFDANIVGPPPPPMLPGDPFAGQPLFGPTFPSKLFSQLQMLELLSESQNMFLLHVRSYFAVAQNVDIKTNERFYDQINETIRLERIVVDNLPLYNESQTDLDRANPKWMAETGFPPRRWFQDKINIARYGFDKLPSRDGKCELWYSARGPMPVGMLDPLLVPFPMHHLLVYGVLARVWSGDSELRDPQRAEYAEKRFRFGVNLALRFMGEVEAAAAAVPAKAFNISPLQIAEGQ